MVVKTKRFTIYTKPELIEMVQKVAEENNTSVSKVISKYLEGLAEQRITNLMEDGYRAMAEENRLLAEQCLPIALETWPRQGVNSK